jgi:hypothetical protein
MGTFKFETPNPKFETNLNYSAGLTGSFGFSFSSFQKKGGNSIPPPTEKNNGINNNFR